MNSKSNCEGKIPAAPILYPIDDGEVKGCRRSAGDLNSNAQKPPIDDRRRLHVANVVLCFGKTPLSVVGIRIQCRRTNG